MNPDSQFIHALALESDRVETFPKSVSPKDFHFCRYADMTGWADETKSNLSFNPPSQSWNTPLRTRVKNKATLNESINKSPRKVKNSVGLPLPEVISAYEISKTHQKYREVFDQPIRISKERVRLPAINTKSLLSVYLSLGNEKKSVKREAKKSYRFWQGKERRLGRNKDFGEPSGFLMTIFNAINPEKDLVLSSD
jgi:hypothetical protein